MQSRLLSIAIAVSLGACQAEAELPELGRVPAFSLRDQDGAELTREDLLGQVWIANFMFTSCPDICPVLTAKMVGLRTRLRGDGVRVGYVSFSVDPQTDTPAVLKRYAREQGADHDDWRFATGSLSDVQDVVVKGFKQSIQRQPEADDEPANILHGSHFVLVDRSGKIRGYYRSDEEGLLTLARDTRVLQARGQE